MFRLLAGILHSLLLPLVLCVFMNPKMACVMTAHQTSTCALRNMFCPCAFKLGSAYLLDTGFKFGSACLLDTDVF